MSGTKTDMHVNYGYVGVMATCMPKPTWIVISCNPEALKTVAETSQVVLIDNSN